VKYIVGWLKIPQEKVNAMDQSSVQFRDGSGYFFGMDVFHQLHCLNYLRKKTVLYNHLYPSEGEGEDQQIPPEFHIRKCSHGNAAASNARTWLLILEAMKRTALIQSVCHCSATPTRHSCRSAGRTVGWSRGQSGRTSIRVGISTRFGTGRWRTLHT
jgi:hypothetical protein